MIFGCSNPRREENGNASSWRPYSDGAITDLLRSRPALSVMTYSYRNARQLIFIWMLLQASISTICWNNRSGLSVLVMEKVIKQLKVRIEPCQD